MIDTLIWRRPLNRGDEDFEPFGPTVPDMVFVDFEDWCILFDHEGVPLKRAIGFRPATRRQQPEEEPERGTYEEDYDDPRRPERSGK